MRKGEKNSSNEIKRRMKFKPGRSARSRAISGKQEQVCFVWERGCRAGGGYRRKGGCWGVGKNVYVYCDAVRGTNKSFMKGLLEKKKPALRTLANALA